jgi:AraC-like DNA-binding protein
MQGAEVSHQFPTRQNCGILRQMGTDRTQLHPMSTPVSAVYSRALLRRFGATPEKRAQLLAGTGLDEAALSKPGAETSMSSLLALAANITRSHGECWALEASTMWSTAMQGALDVALRSATTVDDALRVAARHGRVRAPYLTVRLQSNRSVRRLVFDPAVAMDESVWRAIAHAVALSVLGLFAQILDGDTSNATIEFPWPAPAYAPQVRAAISCRVRFARRDFAFELPADLGRRMSTFADPALHANALAELAEADRRLTGEETLLLGLERLIANHLPERLREEDAARQLGISRRTLVRRMTSAKIPFRSALDGVLRQRAEGMLADGSMSREAMAAALGYADPTSFSRACRRWFPASAARATSH